MVSQTIFAVDRGGLNKRLLDELGSMPNVKLLFNHKLTGADFNRKVAWFEQRGKKVSNESRPSEAEVHFDFLIGADGAHSSARYHLMKFLQMSYQQEYIDTLWCEFQIPPKEHYDTSIPESQFYISPHHLHIWPGKEYMFIAIPSLVSSFGRHKIHNLTSINHRMDPLPARSSYHLATSKLSKTTLHPCQTSSTSIFLE